MENNNRNIKQTQEKFELPTIWSEFMNDTMSIFSLMESAALTKDEEEFKKIQILADSIGKSIQKKSAL
ncbi:hypothetical protein [Metabacillus halosaccharovorans]|uniref:hypothetical protein n=1 Tax=Metabacillus halosaccharovorans TaxID=930124 RepID=UPI0009954260|nr:hypothetical protein [Metabacillus halosaccharovorans]